MKLIYIAVFYFLHNSVVFSLALPTEAEKNVNNPTEQQMYSHHPEYWIVRSREGYLPGNERITRDAAKNEYNSNNKPETRPSSSNFELSENESGMVFLHALGRRQRREATILNNDEDKLPINITKPNNTNIENGELHNEESGIVFLHSLGKRQKRDTHANRENKRDNDKMTNCNCQTTTKAPVQKRQISSENNDSSKNLKEDNNNSHELSNKKTVSQTKRKEDMSDESNSATKNKFDVAESGLVFLPSIRRQRRSSDLKKQNIQTNTDSKVNHSLKQSKPEPDSHKMFNEAESGLVFLPSVGKQKRSL